MAFDASRSSRLVPPDHASRTAVETRLPEGGDDTSPVPVTVWPLPAAGRPRRRGGRLGVELVPAAAVLAAVRAYYLVPAGRVLVVAGDGGAAQRITDMATRGLVDLLVLMYCSDRGDRTVRGCARLLVPGGLLTVVVPSEVTIDLAAVVASARSAGLIYLQHNVAFPADCDTSEPAVGWARRRTGRRHARAYVDVLVFQTPDRDD